MGGRNGSVKKLKIFDTMFQAYGEQKWWPGDSPFEVSVGAVLTQNTSWTNVEQAINNIKSAGLLDAEKLYLLPDEEMAGLIRPAGYFNVKTRRLKNFLGIIVEKYGGSVEKLFEGKELWSLRRELLEVNGIGPETADAIILYAANMPVFVVDKYTLRIFSRHGFVPPDCSYERLQGLFMDSLPHDRKLFNEYHALIVRLGKEVCRTKPECTGCPLAGVRAY